MSEKMNEGELVNKTGVIIGTFFLDELEDFIVYSEDRDMRRKLLRILRMLNEEETDRVILSLPLVRERNC